MTSTERFRFGDFELRPASRELVRDGDVITVQPKAYDLLLFLLTHRNRAVDKQELQDVLWPDVIVTETALTRCVMKARRAVDDDAESQAVIKTVHGHGYRFVAEVQITDDDSESYGSSVIESDGEHGSSVDEHVRDHGSSIDETAGPNKDPAPSWFQQRIVWSVVATVLALGVVLWMLRPLAVDPQQLRVAVLPVNNATGNVELDWAELGLMSLLTRMLRKEGGLDVPSERKVLALTDAQNPDDPDFINQVAESLGATYFVSARLEATGGLFRLHYALIDQDHSRSERSIVGETATEVATQAGRDLIASLVGDDSAHGFSRVVSEDAFVNEAYARGLSLQLRGDASAARALFKVASEQDPTLFWTRYEYALSTRILGEIDLAAELLMELADEARRSDDYSARTAAFNGLGLTHQLQGRYADAESLYREGLDAAASAGETRLFSPLYVNLAILARRRDDLEAARSYLNQALAVQQKLGLPIGAALLNTLAQLDQKEGHTQIAEENFEKAIAAARRENNRRFEAGAMTNLAAIKRSRGQFNEARVLLEQAAGFRRDLGDEAGVASSAMALSGLLQDLGELGAASASVEQAITFAQSAGDRARYGDALARRASIRMDQGAFDTALQDIQSSISIWREVDEPTSLRKAQLSLAYLLSRQGDYEGAWEMMDTVNSASESLNDMQAISIDLASGRIAQTQGDLARASRDYAAAMERARTVRNTELIDDATAGLALALLLQGQIVEAEPLVAAVVAARPELRKTLLLQGQLARAQGRDENAREFLERAKSRSGELWSAADEQLLRSVQL